MRHLGVLFLSLLAVAAASAAELPKPTLVVAIAVDQYSADLFQQYRPLYERGLARLSSGIVFPRGYQSHASTETCPGHATILTGARPARSGIIANEWEDLNRPRRDGGNATYRRYCVDADDPTRPAGTVTTDALLVPTLGDRMRAADTSSRSVAIAGKDRSAVMMGGKNSSLTLWWVRGTGFVTYSDATVESGMRARIATVNEAVKKSYESPTQPQLPKQCAAMSQRVAVTRDIAVGELQPVAAKSPRWRSTAAFDALTAQMAIATIDEMQLGKQKSVDLLAVSFSAMDYVGHYFGTQGAEMCAQQLALDETIGRLLAHLDKSGVAYVVALTGDHGGLDLPERNSARAVTMAERIDPELLPTRVGEAVAKELGLAGQILLPGRDFTGDVYLNPSIDSRQRPAVLDAVRRKYMSHRQVAKVFTRNELVAAEPPSGPPDEWTLLERAKASFNPQRSGDFVVLLQPYITTYAKPKNAETEYTSSHGSPWDYDRRVPILFWWRGIAGFEQPAAVEVVDIAPTLADLIGLEVPVREMDGRVLKIGQR
jgi:predicted AlkP superfamily pyrophosphatase or phosphodiesterase